MVAGFHSFYWQDCELADPDLARAHAELTRPTTDPAYVAAFRKLLHSGHPVATGIALDHFQYSGALTRFGGTSMLDPYEGDVLAVARHQLRQPAVPDGRTFEGANHASALNAMANLAEATDADLIAEVLANASHPDVRAAGCAGAASALARCGGAHPRLVAAVATIAFDDHLDPRDRACAVQAVFNASGMEATALLVRAAESGELSLQVEGALGLTMHGRFQAHREQVERIAAGWPVDAGYRADEVRDILAGFHSRYWTGAELDDIELRRAHQLLMFPVDEESYRSAYRELLHSGHTVGTGIALDYFSCWEGLRQVLNPDAVETLQADVLAVAREVLREPPSPAALSPQTGRAANHVSALHAIGSRHAEPGDADVVADMLGAQATSEVREHALRMAYGIIAGLAGRHHRLVDVVRQFATDPALAKHRETALRALRAG